MNNLARLFRKMNWIVFLTLQGSFLLIIAITAFVYNYNWDDVFERFQQDQLQVNAYKMMDDMRNEKLLKGPFSNDEIQWYNRRATLYGILIQYQDSEKKTIWFDMISRVNDRNDAIYQEFPVISAGAVIGNLKVAYLKSIIELDPNVIAYRETMKSRSLILFLIILLLSFIVSFFIAKLLSIHLKLLQETASKIRLGNWNVKARIKGPEEVRQLALTLNELAEELKRQENWRHNLMEDLTHELRTPLTSILSQLEAMIDGIYKVDLEWLQQIYDEIIRLSRLMNDMEKLTEAEAARFTISVKRTNMSQLTERVYRNFVSMAKNKGIKLQFSSTNAPCYAEVDRDKMVQVISNIVSNAIKYTNSGGKISLSVDWIIDSTIICCKDTGIGISREDLPYVFNRLYRADKSRSRFSGGVGLGLTIVKALVEAHDGSIEVESQLGKGSMFRVIIPNVYKSLEGSL